MKKIRAEIWLVIVGLIGVLAIVGIYLPYRYQTEVENSQVEERFTNTNSNRVTVVHQVQPVIK